MNTRPVTDRPPVRRIELKRLLASLERALIEEALEMTDNNVSLSARMLGISRSNLINKLRAFKEEALSHG